MKRFFFSLIALAAAAASCTQSALVETPDLFGTEITFNPYTGRTPVTKAQAIVGPGAVENVYGLSEAGGFHVISWLTQKTTNTIYMNDLVTSTSTDGTPAWIYQGNTAYWPDASTANTTTLSFVGFSANALGKYTIGEETTPSANLIEWTTQNEVFTYNVPAKVNEQIDLLATNYQQGLSLNTNADGKVNMHFNHLLSRIGFQVVANQNKDNRNITISSIVFTGNMPVQGTLNLKDANTADAVPALTYTDEMKGVPEYQLLSQAFVTPSSTSAAEISDATNGRYMMIMPHTANGAKIKVTYQIQGMSTARNAVVEIPNTQVFAPGKAYEFILKISTSAITFGVVEEEWNTDHDQSEVEKPVVPGDNNALTLILNETNTSAAVAVTEEYSKIGIQLKTDDGPWKDHGTAQDYDADAESYNFTITGADVSNTTYSVRPYAINAAGEKTYSNEISTFTTLPEVETGSATNVSAAMQATLNGSFPSGQGEANVILGFRYSKSAQKDDTGKLTSDPKDVDAGENTASFSKLIEGLEPNVEYHYQAYAKNDGGIKYAEPKSFKTPILPPVVTTTDVTAISSTSATFNGNLTNNGGDTETIIGFIFSTSSSLTNGALTGTEIDDPTTTENGAFYKIREGLGKYVRYYVQAYAKNDGGKNKAYGEVKDFMTLSETPVVTITVTGYGMTTASFQGEITNIGTEADAAEYGFIYSTSNTQTAGVLSATPIKCETDAFTYNASGLTENTTYYVQSYAKNIAGDIGYSSVISFTTSDSDDPIIDWGDNGTGGGTIDDPSYNQ